jgi:lipoate---protein ligase
MQKATGSMRRIDYKIPDGKLLRIEADIKSGIIKDIKISGDFFLYPEEALGEIEKALHGAQVAEARDLIKDFRVKMVGISPEDIANLLDRFINES